MTKIIIQVGDTIEKGKLFLLEISFTISLIPTYNKKIEIPSMKKVSITIILYIFNLCKKI